MGKDNIGVDRDLDWLKIFDQGFEIRGGKDSHLYRWTDVEAIFGFKLDLITTDEICLDLFFIDQKSIRFSESMPGWNMFNASLFLYFSAIPETWENEIVKPPFETNLTLLYDRKNRSILDAETACYNQTHGK